jgi:uncharacterized protein (DUF433 family)
MPSWKLSIFVSAVKIRYAAGEGSYEEILATYPKLTEEEKAEIMAVLTT